MVQWLRPRLFSRTQVWLVPSTHLRWLLTAIFLASVLTDTQMHMPTNRHIMKNKSQKQKKQPKTKPKNKKTKQAYSYSKKLLHESVTIAYGGYTSWEVSCEVVLCAVGTES